MFQFQIVEYIYLLPLVFVLGGLFYLFARWRKSALLKLADQGLIERLTQGGILDTQWVRFGYFALATTFALIALSNPQWGNKQQRVKAKSSDIVIALDISQSMMAQDILPNRMERAKRFTERLIKTMQQQRSLPRVPIHHRLVLKGQPSLMPSTSPRASLQKMIRIRKPSSSSQMERVMTRKPSQQQKKQRVKASSSLPSE